MPREIVFNHDGYGILGDLAKTSMSGQDAADLLVHPLADAGVTIIDWSILTTGLHNCRTRHGRLYDRAALERAVKEVPSLNHPGVSVDRVAISTVIEHFAAQEQDLLDIVIKHGHARGLKVFGNIRLNHANASVMLDGIPGHRFGHGGNARIDFRDEAFHAYLAELFEDLLVKGVDGLSLDFERKAPFFPEGTPQEERCLACRVFMRRIRALTDKPVIARVAYEATKGAVQGQDPEGWLCEGLLDAIVPATHNHELDRLDWGFERFVKAAAASPRACAVWPQIWPTPHPWREPLQPRHTPEAIVKRSREILAAGGNGVYFFNFCCYWPRIGSTEPETEAMFRTIHELVGSPREKLARMLAIPRTRVDLNPEKRGELDLGDGVVVEKWIYTSEPGSHIPANLYRPKEIKGRIPGIVLTCGHGSSKSAPHMSYVARTYARIGLVCLLADPLGEEDRHPQGGMGTREHDQQWVVEVTQAAGRPVMGKLVFDAMRGIDFLETLDCVDPERLGVAGNSLGGATAGWIWVLEPRLRTALVSGWAFGDYLCVNGKHCTNWPNQQMRGQMQWPEYLRIGMENAPVLILNGDADVILDRDESGTIWREMKTSVLEADPDGERIRLGWIPGGGHRPYYGSKHALRFIQEQLGTPAMTVAQLDALPELHYGTWCDANGITLEQLYGVELHYRGAIMPDLGFAPIPRERLSVLTADEVGTDAFTTKGWLTKAMEHKGGTRSAEC